MEWRHGSICLTNNTMLAISIRQPWASLIVSGYKLVENRSWKLPQKYFGKDILIHAGMKFAKDVEHINKLMQVFSIKDLDIPFGTRNPSDFFPG